MPSWNEILQNTTSVSTFDSTRRQYLKELHDITGRNTILYYSGWLQKPNNPNTPLSELDKNGFMATIHQLDRDLGLDLILHTEGGEIAVTESLVNYLRQMFGKNIRAIVPQIAMSAGTMIALSCKEILMGKHSSLGPIDPQYGNLSAHAVIEEFYRANKELTKIKVSEPMWQLIIAKYGPTLVGECEKSIKWADRAVRGWLQDCMFDGDNDPKVKIDKIMSELADHTFTLSHARRISIDRVRELGINVIALEDHQDMQEAVMNIHHTCMITLERSNAFKLIENHLGIAYIRSQVPQIVPV